jgi:molybdopterin converting factor small subunit
VEAMFYGKLAERIGRAVELECGCATVAGLREALANRFPDARAELLRPSLRACVGDDLVGDDFVLEGVALVEFFPPLSGG